MITWRQLDTLSGKEVNAGEQGTSERIRDVSSRSASQTSEVKKLSLSCTSVEINFLVFVKFTQSDGC